MGIARGIAKAAKAQSRGLSGKRNAQGDFIAERPDLRTDGPDMTPGKHTDAMQKSVEPDIQKYVNDVRNEWEDLQEQIMELSQEVDFSQSTGLGPEDTLSTIKYIDDLEARQDKLIDDLIEKLEEEGVEVPYEIKAMRKQEDGSDPELANDRANREPEFDSPLAHDMNQFYSQQ